MTFSKFKQFLQSVFNIENHPFASDIFAYFDKDQDYLIDFGDLVRGLNIAEKGNFLQKCEYAFEIYDMLEFRHLDIFTLREVLKKSYVNQLILMEECISIINNTKTKYNGGFTWEEFESLLLPKLE